MTHTGRKKNQVRREDRTKVKGAKKKLAIAGAFRDTSELRMETTG